MSIAAGDASTADDTCIRPPVSLLRAGHPSPRLDVRRDVRLLLGLERGLRAVLLGGRHDLPELGQVGGPGVQDPLALGRASPGDVLRDEALQLSQDEGDLVGLHLETMGSGCHPSASWPTG